MYIVHNVIIPISINIMFNVYYRKHDNICYPLQLKVKINVS